MPIFILISNKESKKHHAADDLNEIKRLQNILFSINYIRLQHTAEVCPKTFTLLEKYLMHEIIYYDSESY